MLDAHRHVGHFSSEIRGGDESFFQLKQRVPGHFPRLLRDEVPARSRDGGSYWRRRLVRGPQPRAGRQVPFRLERKTGETGRIVFVLLGGHRAQSATGDSSCGCAGTP